MNAITKISLVALLLNIFITWYAYEQDMKWELSFGICCFLFVASIASAISYRNDP